MFTALKESPDCTRGHQMELKFSKFPGGGPPDPPNGRGPPPPIPSPGVGCADTEGASAFLCPPAQWISQPAELFLSNIPERRVANKRKATRLTEEKKEIMDKCFDSGVKRESAYVYSSTLPERNGKRNCP